MQAILCDICHKQIFDGYSAVEIVDVSEVEKVIPKRKRFRRFQNMGGEKECYMYLDICEKCIDRIRKEAKDAEQPTE